MGLPIIFLTISSGNLDALNIFWDYGVDPNTTISSTNLLLWSIKYKNSEAVKILIDNKVDVNKKFKNKLPLNIAIKKKQSKIVV